MRKALKEAFLLMSRKIMLCLLLLLCLTGCKIMSDETGLELTTDTVFLSVGDLFVPSLYVKESSGKIEYPTVDTNKLGNYEAIYIVKDKNGHQLEKVLNVVITLRENPILKLKTDKIELTKEELTAFNYLDYVEQCTDSNGNDLKAQIQCTDIDLNKEEQNLLFRVVDRGVSAEATLTVVLKDNSIDNVVEEQDSDNKEETIPDQPNIPEQPVVPTIPQEPAHPKPSISSQELYIMPRGTYLNMDEAYKACQDLGAQSRLSYSCTPIETETEFLGYYLKIGN